MPQVRGRRRGQLSQALGRERNRGRRETARERKLSEIREADRFDARRAARIARSKKREAYELLREPSTREVEEARRDSDVDGQVEVPPDTIEEESGYCDKDGESVWWVRDDEDEVDWNGDEEEDKVEKPGGEHNKLKRRRISASDDRSREGNTSSKKLKKAEFDNESTTAVSGSRKSSSWSKYPLSSTTGSGATNSTKIEAPSLDAIEQQEKEFLHSDAFPVSDIQPARNFLEVMAAIADVFGDSGAGWSRFGPESPIKPILLSSTEAALDRNRYVLSNSIEAQRYDPNSLLYEKERKFSQVVEPRLRSRHLEIDLLQRKISHGELLSLKLSSQARRAATDIGGSPSGVVSEYASGPGGWVLWRLVRVSAKVVIPGGGEELHVAWYAILNRSLAGFF